MCPSVSEFIIRLGSVIQLCTKLEINLRIREFRKHIYYQVLISTEIKDWKVGEFRFRRDPKFPAINP